MTPHRLSQAEARRIAVRAQLLDARRPADLFDVVRRLGLLQNDPTAAVAPSAQLVVWSRLGSAYSPTELDEALEDQSLLELHGFVRPAEDLALFRADMEIWPDHLGAKPWHRSVAGWLEANEECRLDLVERLRQDGPLPVSELPDTCVVPWKSSGWNNHRNVGRMIELMVARGQVAAAGREGRERLWDLAERIYPDDPPVPSAEAERTRDERRLAALGLARATTTEAPGEPNHVGDVGEEAVIEDVRGTWRVDPGQLDRPFEGRTALLSPLDRLVFDRKRMVELFEFDYQLEMYKPAAKRRWGYWALPVLHGDRLVGKVDATAERDAGVLRVDAVHEDEPFDPGTAAAVHAELEDLAHWLDLGLALERPLSGTRRDP